MSTGRAQLFNSVDYNDVATATTTERAPPSTGCALATAALVAAVAAAAAALSTLVRGRRQRLGRPHPRNGHLSFRLPAISPIPAKSPSQITAETWKPSLSHRSPAPPCHIALSDHPFLMNHLRCSVVSCCWGCASLEWQRR